MTGTAPAVIAVGECMLELAPAADGWRLGHAGDTFNTALYLAREGVPVGYLSALGTDPFSAGMRAAWRAEGIDDSLVLSDAARLPGLYAIRTDEHGERTFYYWRDRSAVRNLFRLDGIEEALARAAQAELLYLSGITLSIFEAEDRTRLLALAAAVRRNGGMVAFDPNYRPAGWPDAATARDSMREFSTEIDIVLATFEDERTLWSDVDAGASAARWHTWGVREVVIKLGATGAMASVGGISVHESAERVAHVVDTTGAGDSFNAAYLALRRGGADIATAARAGNRLAAQVIQVSGAILPRPAQTPLPTRTTP